MRRHSVHIRLEEKPVTHVCTFPRASVINPTTLPTFKQTDVIIKRRCSCLCPKRWILAFSLCFMRMCQSALRQNMGMALVCMTETPDDVNATSSNASQPNQTYQSPQQETTEFHWSSGLEGHVLSASHYGSLLILPLAGFLDHVIGPCRVLTLSLGVGGVLSLLTPLLTRQHPYLLVANRGLVGAVSEMVKPAVFSLWSNWAPLTEQGILTAVDYAGANLGGILTYFFSGFLCLIPLDHGWPFVFYVVGVLCLVCAIVSYATVYNRPDLHPSISQAEKELIRDKTHDMNRGKVRVPWCKIVRSSAVWAIVLAHCCRNWVQAVLSYLPMYLNDRLHYSIAESGMLSATAYVGSMVVGLLGGAAADRMRKHFRQGTIRKIFQLGGSLGLSVPLGFVSWLSSGHPIVAVFLLVLAVSLYNLTSVAYRINSLDIAPCYAGFITSMSSTLATALSATGPLVVSAILKSKSPEEWQTVLILVALVGTAGGIFYVIFAQGEPQRWALAHTYDVTPGLKGVTVNGDDVTPHVRRRSLPDDFKELPGTSVVLSVRRLQTLT